MRPNDEKEFGEGFIYFIFAVLISLIWGGLLMLIYNTFS